MKKITKPNNLSKLSIAGILFLTAGLIFAIQPFQRYQTDKQVSATPFPESTQIIAAPEFEYISGRPIHITLPSIGISLEVIDGSYNKNNNSWTLSKDKAQFALLSTLANNLQGNTFIYGHNNKYVFRDLHKITEGDEAIVTTDNGHEFVYKMTGVHVVDPTDTSIFKYSGPPILTVQTCSGAWYENRSLYTFEFVEVR
ncbi:sortase [Candidatus Saccharibacteria bacterium]|nr:sortase [Candidatus Saccharibacteria bacterium]